jgi:SAM-dependent methyltransferase
MALSFNPERVVEIGVGPGVARAVLELVDVTVTTVDVQPELEPDVVGSILDLPLEDDACDVALCCQVLEHLPFEHFGTALRELRRISRLGVILSLPDCTPHYEIRIRLPVLPAIAWSGTRRLDPGPAWKEEKRRNDGHHWEIGYEGFGLEVVRSAIAAAGLTIAESFRVPEKPYHRMFKLVSEQDRP